MKFHLPKTLRQFWKHEVVYFLLVLVYIYANIEVLLGLPDTVLDTIIIQILPVYITVEGVLIGLATQIKTRWLRDAIAVLGLTSMLLAIRTLIIATYQHLQLTQSSVTGTTSGFVSTSVLFLVFVEVYAFALLIPSTEKPDLKSEVSGLENEAQTEQPRFSNLFEPRVQTKSSALAEEIRVVTNTLQQLETKKQAQQKRIDELGLRPHQINESKFQPLFETLQELTSQVEIERQKLIGLQLGSISSSSERLESEIQTLNDSTKKLLKSSTKLEYFSAVLIIVTVANVSVILAPTFPLLSVLATSVGLIALLLIWTKGRKKLSQM